MASTSASSAARLYMLVGRQSSRLQTLPPRVQQLARSQPTSRRAFTTSSSRWEDETPTKDQKEASEGKTETSTEQNATSPKQEAKSTPSGSASNSNSPLSMPSRNTLTLQTEEALHNMTQEGGFNKLDRFLSSRLRQGPASAQSQMSFDQAVRQTTRPIRDRRSFWFDPDDPDHSTEEHDQFDEDDMTEMAHAKLEEVKEMRQYARLAVWELPLLSSTYSVYGGLHSVQVMTCC